MHQEFCHDCDQSGLCDFHLAELNRYSLTEVAIRLREWELVDMEIEIKRLGDDLIIESEWMGFDSDTIKRTTKRLVSIYSMFGTFVSDLDEMLGIASERLMRERLHND